MRLPALSLALVILSGAVAAGCARATDTTVPGGCVLDSDCPAFGYNGPCLQSPLSTHHYCSESAKGCASGLAWADNAGDNLAGSCVEGSAKDASVDLARRDGGGSDLGNRDLAVSDFASRDLSLADLATPDLSVPDLAMPDLATPRDLSSPPDLAKPDLAKPDLVMPDLATPPDLLPPPDLSVANPDLVPPPPDLLPPPDLTVTPDLVTPPDLVTLPDLAQCAIQGCASAYTTWGNGCKNANTIGRKTAATTAGWSYNDANCYAQSSFGGVAGCAQGGWDVAYKIFLRAGERVTASASNYQDCNSNSTFNYMLTLVAYYAGACAINCSGYSPLQCSSNKTTPALDLTATQDGWYLIVLDEQASYDSGWYTINVKLNNCAQPNCECP